MIKNAKGKQIQIEGISEGVPYSNIIYSIEKWAAQKNLLIIEVLANNIPVDRDDESGLSKKMYSEKDDILVKTQKPGDAALTAIREAKNQIPAFEKLIELPAGSRPLRTMVGLDFGLQALNDAVEPIRKGILESMGLADSDGPQS